MYQTRYQNYIIHGEDVRSFLQGQFSCDMEEVDKNIGVGQAAAYCLPDGKVLGYFYLSQISSQRYLLSTNDAQAGTFLKRLKMFILRSKVTFEEVGYAVYGIEKHDTQVDSTQGDVESLLGDTITIALNRHLNLVLSPEDEGVDQRAYSGQKLRSHDEWNYLETLNGIPAMDDRLRGKLILPFINLDWLGAVSYHKGCYVGQEIIARLYYRSKPAKRSYIYTADGDLSDLPIAETMTCVDGDQKTCRITPIRTACWQDRTAIMLAMTTRNAPRDRLILTHNEQQYDLDCAQQPYEKNSI